MSELDAIIDDIKAVTSKLVPGTPLPVIREGIDDFFAHEDPACRCSRTMHRIGEVDAELIVPAQIAGTRSVILYLHGGGYITGSIRSHRGMCERLAHAAQLPVLLLGFRLAPEHPFPAALDDAIGAYSWLLEQGYEAASIAIAGDSAGGGLSVATLLALKAKGLPLPSCTATMSPWVDLELGSGTMVSKADEDPLVTKEMLQSYAACYASDGNVRNPLVSPVFGDLRGLPPLMIQVGESEVLFDDALRLADAAKAVGVDVELQIWKHQIHVFQIFSHRLADARKAIGDVGIFIRRHVR